MSTGSQMGAPRRAAFFAGMLALALGAWACSNSTGGGGGKNSGGGGHAGSTGNMGGGGSCVAYGTPDPPARACSLLGDVSKECPLPPSVTMSTFDGTNVYYYTDPTCDGVCHYCSTMTYTEDPNATAAP